MTGRSRPPRGVDFTGRRFGHLTVIGKCGKGADGANRWKCACDCGGVSVRPTGELLRAERDKTAIGCMSCRKARASVVALENIERRATKVRACWQCGNLPHRRPATGCRACGKPYGPDVVEYALPTAGCGIGRVPW